MVLELHILGPGLGLPSIDAECLAAILYLQRAFDHHTDSPWRLIPSNDFDISPFRQLPALRALDANDQESWVAGYENIVAYLKETLDVGAVDLDEGLDELQRADSCALMAFIRSRGGPLLDLSLYVSSENYNSHMRPALGHLLQWPESWTIPHRLRADARKRSEHLGLSALDVDMAKTLQEKEANEGLASHIPKSLRKPKLTVTGMLGKSAQQTRFRLEAVTEDFMEPLQNRTRRGEESRSLVGEGVHTVDCLALAYLVLMQLPQLPQAWLREMLAAKYPILNEWVNVHAREQLRSSQSSLPWHPTLPRTLPQTGIAIIESIVGSIPLLNVAYDSGEVELPGKRQTRSRADKQLAYADKRKRQIRYGQLLTSAIATTSLLAWLVQAGWLSFSRSTAVSRKPNYGEAGSILLGL